MTTTYEIGDHVICPVPWCGCGYALGIAPAEVVAHEDDDLVVKLDTTDCSTYNPRFCEFPRQVFTTAEIEALSWLL